jgi:hypothetical protein
MGKKDSYAELIAILAERDGLIEENARLRACRTLDALGIPLSAEAGDTDD